MVTSLARIVVRTLNDTDETRTYDLKHEVVRAIEFALVLAGRPRARPTCLDISRAIAPAFAIDDLMLVGTLHMLSQLDVYTEALRGEPFD